MKINIHYERFDKPVELYTETFVEDDGVRLITQSVVPPEIAIPWSEKKWQKKGMLKAGQIIHTVRKYHFYQEWFAIMELRDSSGLLLGYYCDVVKPLEKRGDGYYLHDLVLDLWIFPDGSYRELDREELDVLVYEGKVDLPIKQKACEVMSRMLTEKQNGIFPQKYIGALNMSSTSRTA